MLIGVAQRQEAEEPFVVVDPEIVEQDFRRALHIAQDHAVVLQHSAWGPASAAGVDDAGRAVALDPGDAFLHRLARLGRVARQHRIPAMVVEAARLLAMKILDADHMLGHPARLQRAVQGLEQLLARNDHRLGARIVEDMDVIAFGVGDVGGNGDRAGSHNGQVRNAPLRAVFGYQHHPVAILDTDPAQVFGQQAHLLSRLPPALSLPRTIALCAKEWRIALFIGTTKEKLDQILRRIEFG